jgi:predicted GH43/DUF377 family glycosyl hydrolase
MALAYRGLKKRRRRAAQRKANGATAQVAQPYAPEAVVDYPGVVAQAVMAGFRCDLVADLPGGPYHYNAGLVEHGGRLLLAYRDQEERDGPTRGGSRIGIAELRGDPLEPHESRVLDLPPCFENRGVTESREDPRLFVHAGSLWMSYAAWDRQGVCGQALARLTEKRRADVENGGRGGAGDLVWDVDEVIQVDYANNFSSGKWQKNWAFLHDYPTLRMVYAPDPHEVVDVGADGRGTLVARERGVQWQWGQVRGGTPPVLHNGLYWSFFHSRLMSQGPRFRYFAGAYAFGPRPPHRPEVVSVEPILGASRHDPNRSHLPLVVFPCGAVMRDGEWWVSLGVNDHSTAVARIPHDWLVKRMRPA